MARKKNAKWGVLLGLGLIGTMAVVAPAGAQQPRAASAEPEEVGFFRAAGESLTGDVYAEPSRWRPLSLGTFFSEGWNQAWASPSAGGMTHFGSSGFQTDPPPIVALRPNLPPLLRCWWC